MAETSTKLGRVSLVPRGEYDASAVYDRLDVVEYDGSGYLALADGITGVTPENGQFYMLLAAQGGKGDPGTPGGKGDPGQKGDPGVGIQSVERTAGDGSPGTADTYTITLTNGNTSAFTVYNGADGTSFTVLGRYDTLSALQAAHPTGSEGDAWAVGSVADNDIYLWDVDQQMWTNVGSLQGAQGPQGTPGQNGANGTTFTPSVSEDGVLSWTNDGGLADPEPVNVKGPAGADGAQGQDGAPGADGKSAYQYAQDGGYTGTEAEFAALLANAATKQYVDGLVGDVASILDTINGEAA